MSIKEKILTGLLGLVLTILIVKEISRPVSKPVETSEITKEILKKLDSIKVKDTMIYVKEQENKKLLKELVGIKKFMKGQITNGWNENGTHIGKYVIFIV